MKNKLLIAIISLCMCTPAFAELASAEGKGKVKLQLQYLGFDGESAGWGFAGGGYVGAFLGAAIGGPAGAWAGGVLLGGGTAVVVGKGGTAKIKTVKLKWDVMINEFAEGKANVIIMGSEKKQCAPFALKMIGVTDATGAYALYQDEEHLAASQSFGEMIVSSKKIHIELSGEQSFITKGKDGYDCVWTLPEDTAVRFKRTQ